MRLGHTCGSESAGTDASAGKISHLKELESEPQRKSEPFETREVAYNNKFDTVKYDAGKLI